MTGAVASRRLLSTLALSAAVHLLLVASLAPDGPGRTAGIRAAAILTVRLAPRPAATEAAAVLPQPEVPAPAPRPGRPARDSDRAPRAVTADLAPRPDRNAHPLAVPPGPDPTYYGARDLDEYPRLAAPLELGRIAAEGTVTGRVELALLIDEQGIVIQVQFAQAARDRLTEALRAALAATRFVPARKDGRAVKSRVNLSVDLGQETREP
jgi:protein TonB